MPLNSHCVNENGCMGVLSCTFLLPVPILCEGMGPTKKQFCFIVKIILLQVLIATMFKYQTVA